MSNIHNSHKISAKTGLAPGTMVHIGDEQSQEVKISIFQYNAETLTEVEQIDLKDVENYLHPDTITWVNVDGVHDIQLIDQLGKAFNLHPLLLEDIVNTQQRPKAEDFDDYIFVTLKMISNTDDTLDIKYEHVSFVLGSNYVLSFLEDPGDVFDPIRNRLRTVKGKLRSKRSDYLVYSLIDVVIDNYFSVLESVEHRIDELEDEVLLKSSKYTVFRLQRLKRELAFLFKSVFPLREAIGRLEKLDTVFIQHDTKQYLRDLHDHVLQAIESLEIYRDIISNTMEINLSQMNNRMNEIMKVLTIISTIFMPLTFIVGVYGMNFKYFPELTWEWGYAVVWGVMISITVAMLAMFRRWKWL